MVIAGVPPIRFWIAFLMLCLLCAPFAAASAVRGR